jgi:putative nucleotidyltransferase with HDIG domain
MANGNQTRTRSQRVASLELPPGRIAQFWTTLRGRDAASRIAVCLLGALAMLAVSRAWEPPQRFRVGFTPVHHLVASLPFEAVDREGGAIHVRKGEVLAEAGRPLTEDEVEFLSLEHRARLAEQTSLQRLMRLIAIFGLIVALYGVCAYQVITRESLSIRTIGQLAILQGLVVGAILVSRVLSRDPWRAELIPLMLLGMTIAIAYSRQLALLISASLALLMVVTIGLSLGDLIVALGATSVAILLLHRIRSRSKLIKVGLVAAAITAVVTTGMGILEEQPFAQPLLIAAGLNALWALAAGFLITGLLPFIEKMFNVVTEISLLELGDVAHPLLQELVRRAPGTYNHSINVASLAEAAADAIGANGLLVRVGAYFHDIGKMFKPSYFIENSSREGNQHATLVPAMSTLIIIAHVKDGADLARQHHLPRPIIDFIEQHHGSTLVEFFYERANQLSESNPDSGNVSEESFRYPGPKPQSLEAGVLMLADAVESASRVLVDPAPARIESLVEEISMKRLLDGQFDECGLNLQQLRIVQDSLIKSLMAVYHSRIKYPSQQTA